MEEKGLPPMQAALEGTREIGLAVLATTLSLVAVFLPVAFMGGIVGRFMNSFGLTMAFSILVSLFVAFTLTPMMASRWLSFDRTRAARLAGVAVLRRDRARVRAGARAGRWRTAGSSCWRASSTLVSVVPLFIFGGKDFLPKNDESQFEVEPARARGHHRRADRADRHADRREVKRLPGVAYTIVLGRRRRPPHRQPRPRSSSSWSPSSERDAGPVPDHGRGPHARSCRDSPPTNLRTSVSQVAAIAGGGLTNKEVAYFISGPDLRKLGEYSQRIAAALGQTPGVVDIDTTLVLGKPELVGEARPRQGRRARRAGGRRGHDAPDDGRRARRSPPTTRAASSTRSTRAPSRRGARAPTASSQMSVPSTRLGAVSLDHVALVRGDPGPLAGRPARPAATGHDHRQHAHRATPSRRRSTRSSAR